MTKLAVDLQVVLMRMPGRGNAMTGQALANLFIQPDYKGNISNKPIQLAICELREHGIPVCGADKGAIKGYYIPATRQEADECLNQFKARARSTFITCANICKGLNDMFGTSEYQMKMELL